MAKLTIGFGGALILVGLIGFIASGAVTSLIPAFEGIILAICGGIAMNPNARKHAMHAAVMVGLLGFLLAAGRLVGAVMSGTMPTSLAMFSLGAMAVISFVFVLLCVRSFIEARRKSELGAP